MGKSAGTGLAQLDAGEVCDPNDDKCSTGNECTGDKKPTAADGTKTCKAKPKPKKSAGTGLAQLDAGEVCDPNDDKCSTGNECTGDKKPLAADGTKTCKAKPKPKKSAGTGLAQLDAGE